MYIYLLRFTYWTFYYPFSTINKSSLFKLSLYNTKNVISISWDHPFCNFHLYYYGLSLIKNSVNIKLNSYDNLYHIRKNLLINVYLLKNSIFKFVRLFVTFYYYWKYLKIYVVYIYFYVLIALSTKHFIVILFVGYLLSLKNI